MIPELLKFINLLDWLPKMPTKEQLIAQGTWDPLKDKPYENRTVQASQSSNIIRSLQLMGDLEKDSRPKGQTQAGSAPQGSGSAGCRCENALQIKKEAFCVVEELVKYLGSKGHHLSHAYGIGYEYLNKTRPEIS